MSMYCPFCGEQLPDGSRFCSGCGNALPTGQPAPQVQNSLAQQMPAVQPEPVAQPVVVPQPVYQQPVYQQPVYQQPTYQEPAFQQNSLAQQQPAPVAEPVYQQPAYQPQPEPTYVPQPEPAYQQNSLAQQQPAPVVEPVYQQQPAPVVEPVYQQEPAPMPEPEPTFVPQPEPVYLPEPEPVYQPEPEVIPTEPQKKGPGPIAKLKDAIRYEARGGFGRQLLATLVCILMFLFVTVAVVILDVRTATGKDGLNQIVGAVQIEDVKASDLGIDSDDDFLLWAIDQAYPEGNAAYTSKKAVRKAVEDSALMDFAVDKASDLFNDLYTGDDEFEITDDDIRDQMWENDELMEEFGIHMTPVFADSVTNWMVDTYKLDDLDTDTIRDKMPILEPVMQYGLSYVTAYILLVLALGCFVLLFFIQKGRILSAFNQTGITLTVFSTILLIPTAIAALLGTIWQDIFGGNYLIATVAAELLKMNYLLPLSLFGAGLLLIIVPSVLRGWAKK